MPLFEHYQIRGIMILAVMRSKQLGLICDVGLHSVLTKLN